MKTRSPNSTWQTILILVIMAAFIVAGVYFLPQHSAPSTIKVTLQEKGYEHRYTPLMIQWLDQDSVVTQETTLNNQNPNVWALSIDTMEDTPNGLILNLSDTHIQP